MTAKKENKAKGEGVPFIDPLIHAPARFRILSNLYLVESVDFLFLCNLTELTRGNLSSHLSKLEGAGYVEIKKEFVDKIPRTTISMSQTGKDAFKQYRQNMKNMLDEISD